MVRLARVHATGTRCRIAIVSSMVILTFDVIGRSTVKPIQRLAIRVFSPYSYLLERV